MKIIAFGASTSNSINKNLATYAASLFENASVEVIRFKRLCNASLMSISKNNW
jgi:NAD(P)H-dependent FMN reductase